MKRLLLLLLFALPLFTALDVSSVWDANEAFYVQTPREMLDRSDWVVPYFNSRPRLNKPPLAYWSVLAFYRLFGVALYWERLLMALLGTGSILALYRIGRDLFDPVAALWGAGIFATTFRFLILSRRLLIDVLLLFCLLMALAFFVSWLKNGKTSPLLLSALFFGLGFLSKGPVVLPAMVALFLFLVLSGRLRRLKPTATALATFVFLAVSSSWFVMLAIRSSWKPVRDFFWQENVGRFAYLDFGPSRGPFYYAGVFLGDFFPWSIFFLAGLVWWILQGRRRQSANDADAFSLLLLWMAFWMLTFSFSHNKQEYYILPVYPVASLWIAYYWHKAKVSRWPGWLIAVPLLVGAGGLLLVTGLLFPETVWVYLPPLILLLVVVLIVWHRWTSALVSLSVFYVACFAIYSGPLENYRPVARFARTIQRLQAQPSSEYEAGYYQFTAPSLSFYLNRPVFEFYSFEEAVELLDASKPVYLLCRAEDFESLQQGSAARLEVVESRPLFSTNSGSLLSAIRSAELDRVETWTRTIYLITNRIG